MASVFVLFVVLLLYKTTHAGKFIIMIIYLSIYLSICLSVWLTICLSFFLYIYIYIYKCVCVCVCVRVSLYVCLWLRVFSYTFHPIGLWVCFLICLSIYLYVYLLIYEIRTHEHVRGTFYDNPTHSWPDTVLLRWDVYWSTSYRTESANIMLMAVLRISIYKLSYHICLCFHNKVLYVYALTNQATSNAKST